MEIKSLLNKAIKSGFFHVFTASIFSNLVAFCASIVYTHLLHSSEFGIYSFCYTIITFTLLVNGFGAASGILQFVSKSSNQQLQLSYLRYAMRLGIIFNCILSILILLYANLTHLPIAHSKAILIAMAFFPIGRLYLDVFQAYLRAIQQNHLLAKFSILNNSILLIINICGIYFLGIWGLIIGTYLSYIIIILYSNLILKLPNPFKIKTENFNHKEFLSYSVYATIGNAFSQILFNLDIIILGYLIRNPIALANYKVATIIPFALNFIPSVIATFFYPLFAKNSNNNSYMKTLIRKISIGILIFSIPSSIILIIIAKPLITTIFGQHYIASVLAFRILILGFPLASLRVLYGNVLAALGKARFAMWFNSFIASINIIITYTLVKKYGITGAAISIVSIYFIATIFAKYAVSSNINSTNATQAHTDN